ncbi:hypothetical protein AaE_010537 [Aphanomyces astaci]|uniref:HTH CENPB-type domain-containing protein n=1 Tax=Aphanomyces astaci TaxID=112090 RepID=A0A6A4ZY35_APHAT|nr:hypothetical protein AaE_010537 [Aphanomyces astaci]
MVATIEQIEEAVQRVLRGESKAAVVRSSQVKRTTLFKFLKAATSSEAIKRNKCGPKPLIPNDVEDDVVAWVASMQRAGCPVTRHDVLIKARQTVLLHTGVARDIGRGWYQRFSQRHPELTGSISRQRRK